MNDIWIATETTTANQYQLCARSFHVALKAIRRVPIDPQVPSPNSGLSKKRKTPNVGNIHKISSRANFPSGLSWAFICSSALILELQPSTLNMLRTFNRRHKQVRQRSRRLLLLGSTSRTSPSSSQASDGRSG